MITLNNYSGRARLRALFTLASLAVLPAFGQSVFAPCGTDVQVGALSSSPPPAAQYLNADGVVTSSGNVVFQAGSAICFGPGFDFKSSSGGTLTAQIAPLAAGFAVSAAGVSVPAGSSAGGLMTIMTNDALSGAVALTFGQTGLTASISASVGALTTTSVSYTVQAASSVAPGIYTGKVSVGGVSAANANLTVTVVGPPGFSLSYSGAGSVAQGQSAQIFVSINPYNGYTGTPALSILPNVTPVPPAGVTVAFGGGNGVVPVTVSASSSVPAGPLDFYIRGIDPNNGAAYAIVYITMMVTSPSNSPAPQTVSFTAQQGNVVLGLVSSVPVSATATSGLPVVLAASGVPAGACTLLGSTVNIVAVGECTITASQAGNSSYAAASAMESFQIVSSQSPAFTPTYTCSCAAPATTTPTLMSGQSTQVFITLHSNGYSGVPGLALYPGSSLPAGVTVAFDTNTVPFENNNGQEVYGLVTATIAASPGATLGQFDVSIQGVDPNNAAPPFLLTIPAVVTAPPLAPLASPSIMYSGVSPQTKLGTLVTLTAVTTGGTPPFSYSLTGSGINITGQSSPVFANLAAPSASLSATLTVTDATSMTQSVTFTIQSPPQLPEAALQYAVLNRIAALSQPGVDAWFSTLLQAQTGLSNTNFSTVSTLANQLHNQRAGIRQQIRMGITVPAHKSAASVESYASSLVSTEQQSEAGLPAVYLQSLQQSMGPAFSQLDAFAWSQVAPALYYCDDFCDPGDPGSPGGPSLPQNAWMLVDAAIYVNPNDGSLIAYADAEIAGFDPTSAAFDAYTCVNAAVTGINGLQQDCEEDLNASVQVFEYPPTVGTYTINAAGWYTLAADVAVNESSNNGYANASAQVNNAVSCAPTISSVQVNYQPTNAIAVGTTTNYGSLMVFGTCMDSTSQISIAPDPASDDAGDPTGLTVAISAPAGGTLVSAGYSIDPSAQPGSLVLTLTTAGGTATSPVEIVQSGPYIDLVSPDAWSPGTTTLGVTITGAGFGTIPGTVSVTAQNPSYPVNVAGIVSWGDGTIVMNVSTTAGDPGQDVTVTVTGGTYGQQFAQNQGAGKQAQGNAAVAASQCTDPALNKLIAEYMTFGSALHPTCASFQALQMVGTPAAMQHLSISVALGTNVPTSDLNWSLYNWAIVLPSLTTGLNSILANTAIGITSAYRNPVKENSGSSRHVFGDAADLNTQSSDTVWQTLFNSVHSALTGGVNYCIEPKAAADPPPPAGTKVDYSTNSHLHVDWRPGSCPNYWLQ